MYIRSERLSIRISFENQFELKNVSRWRLLISGARTVTTERGEVMHTAWCHASVLFLFHCMLFFSTRGDSCLHTAMEELFQLWLMTFHERNDFFSRVISLIFRLLDADYRVQNLCKRWPTKNPAIRRPLVRACVRACGSRTLFDFPPRRVCDSH